MPLLSIDFFGGDRLILGEESREGTTPLSNAFVMAENFIMGISSSELSFNEYVRACDSTGTESERCKGSLEGLNACLEGLRERDEKWEDPMGVGDAVAISGGIRGEQ